MLSAADLSEKREGVLKIGPGEEQSQECAEMQNSLAAQCVVKCECLNFENYGF